MVHHCVLHHSRGFAQDVNIVKAARTPRVRALPVLLIKMAAQQELYANAERASAPGDVRGKLETGKRAHEDVRLHV